MTEHDPVVVEPITPHTPEPETPSPGPQSVQPPPAAEAPSHPVDPVRAAAGRLGGQRVHELVRLGLEYEREHGLKAGRQRQKQLIQLGRRYEQEHGLAASKPRRRKKGDVWKEFLAALARVVKPAHRRALEHLVASVQPAHPVEG
ncbi:MAG: hypothetical protein JWO38_223 [Gemmataceae bacterium]|nr:hypothetical protein [Gemmataceae bacterium]